MNKKLALSLLKKYGVIILGCIIYSLGVALFLDANNLAAGGVTGIAIIINNFTGVLDTGVLIIIINIPLLILGAFFFGRNFTLSTLFSTVVSSAFIELWNYLFKTFYHLPITENLLISSIIGGAMFGAGLGLIFRMGSSTGGTDIIVKILRKKFRYLKTGIISMIIDIIIVGASAIVNKGDLELTFFTLLSIVVFTVCFDAVLYGGNSAKLTYIITTQEKSQLICERILKELDIGATYIDGEGAYTNESKRIIMCAVKNILYPKLRDIVRDIDPNAFTIVSSAKEIYGEGYKPHNDEEL